MQICKLQPCFNDLAMQSVESQPLNLKGISPSLRICTRRPGEGGCRTTKALLSQFYGAISPPAPFWMLGEAAQQASTRVSQTACTQLLD